jgi:hypothetical protein
MADSQQVHGGGSTRADAQDARRQGQQGRRPANQQAGHQSSGQGGPGPDVAGDHDNHGQSVAAWTAVGIVFAGALIMAISVIIGAKWLFVVGAVIAVAGGISGKVLSAMGFGVSGRPGH